MDSLEYTEKILADDGLFVNSSVYADETFLHIISKCNYLSAILSSEGEPIYSFERFVKEKQKFTTQQRLLPEIFMSSLQKSDSKPNHRAIVFLSSPFALIKDEVIAFIKNISFRTVNIFFSADSDVIMQNNLDGVTLEKNTDKLISSLPYISECILKEIGIPSVVIHCYSVCLNVIPLLSSSYTRTNLFRFTDPSLQIEPYNLSEDKWVTAILRFLFTYDLDVTNYIFYLGKNSKNIANSIKDIYKSSSDNKGYALLIADHSMDLLSRAKQLHCKDLLAFLRCLQILPSSQEVDTISFSSKENDVDLILKEWLRVHANETERHEGSFISSCCKYLRDICNQNFIAIPSHDSFSDNLQELITLNETLTMSDKQLSYYESTSFISRFISQFQVEDKQHCDHDFFDYIDEILPSISDPIKWLQLFYVQPCGICGKLPTLQTLIDMMILLSMADVLTPSYYSKLASLLETCIQSSKEEQFVSIRRIFTEQDISLFHNGTIQQIKDLCTTRTQENSTLFNVLIKANIARSNLRSSHFKLNFGDYCTALLQCIDEPCNADLNKSTPSSTDIYSTKIPKPVDSNPGYFSFLKSFISTDHDGILTDREGVILVLLDGLGSVELINLLSALKIKNDNGVKDVIVCTHNYGEENLISDFICLDNE